MGNAVGPVALIAAGIYLGYLTITGRAANFAAFLASGGKSVAPVAATPTATVNWVPSTGTAGASAYGGNLTGSSAQMLNALQQQSGASGAVSGAANPGAQVSGP
jgi:hypothetical protein